MTETQHISTLTQDPNNARKHNARNLDMIEQSLRDVGAARSIVIDEHGTMKFKSQQIQAVVEADVAEKLKTLLAYEG